MIEPIADLRQYAAQMTEGSFCPTCDKVLVLLAPRLDAPATLPFYYLCTSCGRVAQAGAGEVAPSEDRDER